MHVLSRFWLIFSIGFCLGRPCAAEETSPLYERDVRPILKAHCFHCHGEGEKPQGGLDLRLRRLVVEGGESGPAIVPGKSADSYLYERVRSGEMPPGDDKKLSAEQVALIGRWIEAGAKTARPEPEQIGDGVLITAEEREHWSFQPIRRPPVPEPKRADRIRTPIDAFVLKRLEAAGLSFAPDADRRTLIRRAALDLLGLPPRPEEVEAFHTDDSPDAWQRQIERLLASPHYGERWGRHWLDAAGYADSEGGTNEDPQRPWAWKYRDYVVRSFNQDKPFDRFIVEQLAGDELLEPSFENLSPEEAELLVATGFLRMAPDGTGSGGVDQPVARNQVVADTIKIVSSSLLGLTVGCAQCHNHRYDPIPQRDYYRFRAIFEPALDWKNWRKPRQRLISLYTDADRRKAAEIETRAKAIDAERLEKQEEFIQQTFERELAKLPEEIRGQVRTARETPAKKRTPEQEQLLKKYPSVNVTAGSLYLYDRKAADELKKMTAEAEKIRATKPKEEFVRALTEIPGRVPATYLFSRGDHQQPEQQVQPAGLTVLAPSAQAARLPQEDATRRTTGRRLAFARRLTDGSHPLVARVLVNRIWMHHFGRGLVPTPGDFGALGQEPTHPRLLDWLAAEFMASGWSVKHLHRLIMTSSVYRQSSQRNPVSRVADPDNRLYGAMPLRRLEAEAIRDSILATSGKLNRKPFGPAVPVMADRVGQFVIGIENLNAGRPGSVIPMHGEEFRRSVYVQVRRSRPLAVLDTFDMPAMDPNCDARASSTVAPQALLLLNNDFVVEQAEQFARRVRREAGQDRDKQVRLAWQLAFCRSPSEAETAEAVEFLSRLRDALESRKDKNAKLDADLEALAGFCQTLLASNEFLYIQ